jgi:hypothetical protein
LLPLAEALFITAAVGWYLLVRPSLTRQSLLGLPPTAWLGLAMLAWVVLRPIWI